VRSFDTNLAITSRTMWADIDVNDTVCKQGRASGPRGSRGVIARGW